MAPSQGYMNLLSCIFSISEKQKTALIHINSAHSLPQDIIFLPFSFLAIVKLGEMKITVGAEILVPYLNTSSSWNEHSKKDIDSKNKIGIHLRYCSVAFSRQKTRSVRSLKFGSYVFCLSASVRALL